MPDNDRHLPPQLAARGVSRRDFMKYCAAVAAGIGLTESGAATVAQAITTAAKAPLKPAIWLEAGSCSGCTESMAQVGEPDIATIVLDILSLNYTETLMMGAGYSAEEAKTDTIARYPGKYLLIYEGAVMTAYDGDVLMIAGKKGTEELVEAAKGAEAIVAVGSCAFDGGWVSAAPNPGGAMGCGQYLASRGIDKPLINLPTCPVNPDWVVSVLVQYLLLGQVPALDSMGRPTAIFGQTIHDNCPRRGHFDNGEFVYRFGSVEEAKNYCLYAMGCKGPQTYVNCPVVRWNRKISWCVEAGSPCIGCASPQWVDDNAPFLGRSRNIDIAGVPFQPQTLGLLAGGVVAAGLVVHGVGMGMAGRIGAGPPTEKQKTYDKKRAAKAKKGGDE
jgi:hydrogenase small subunit